MILVICGTNDASAHWIYSQLKLRGLPQVELITDKQLSFGVKWEHRLGNDGVFLEFTLADGRKICNHNVEGVINRLLFLPQDSLLLIQPGDRQYVMMELTAFFTSWLYSLPQPVLNRATPHGLSGQIRHISEWLFLAAKVGLPVPVYRQSSRGHTLDVSIHARITPLNVPVKTVITVGPYVIDESIPAAIGQGCLKLAEISHTMLMSSDFTIDQKGEWTFAGATTFPDLIGGGEKLIDMLMKIFLAEKRG